MTTLSHVLSFALSNAWAMDEGTHRRMMQLLISREEGVALTAEAISAAARSPMPKRSTEMRVERGVAYVPIQGVIAQRASAVGDICSNVGTSVEHVRADLRAAMNDPQVRSIVLAVDSPGGSVLGIDELATEIRAAREQKPIVAHTDAMMASAAYYLASQANRIVATRSSAVGSVGVIASFLDNSRALANRGYEPVVVKSTPAKGGVQTNGSVSDADRADVQREVDRYHDMFVESIAAGRGIAADEARSMGDDAGRARGSFPVLSLSPTGAAQWVDPSPMPFPGLTPTLEPLGAGEQIRVSFQFQDVTTNALGTLSLADFVPGSGLDDRDLTYAIGDRPEGVLYVLEFQLSTGAPGILPSEPVYVILSPDGEDMLERLHHTSLFLEEHLGIQVPAPASAAVLLAAPLLRRPRRG